MNPPTLKASINNFDFARMCVKPYMLKPSDDLALQYSNKTAPKSVNLPTLTAIKSINLHISKHRLAEQLQTKKKLHAVTYFSIL